jgi:prephenate dehydratase
VPFENSTNGQVTFTYDLLRDWLLPPNGEPSTSNFKIIAEQFVSIHHCVLSHSKDLSKITKIYTHPQAWGQCSNWLNNEGKNLDRIDSSSTSKAAEIANIEGETVAAIASQYASEFHNIPILRKNIENVKDNTTRFLILSKKDTIDVPENKYVTLLAFTVEHNDAGALVKALNILNEHGINMTSITSRPSLIKAWQYVFFIEFSGDSKNDATVKKVIDEFKEKSLNSVVVGTFPRNQRYYGEV